LPHHKNITDCYRAIRLSEGRRGEIHEPSKKRATVRTILGTSAVSHPGVLSEQRVRRVPERVVVPTVQHKVPGWVQRPPRRIRPSVGVPRSPYPVVATPKSRSFAARSNGRGKGRPIGAGGRVTRSAVYRLGGRMK